MTTGGIAERRAVPVLVVGGGPVGLATALFLGRQEVPVLLVDQRPTTSRVPRATHVSRRTMELFREAGLEPDVRAAGFEVVDERTYRLAPDPERLLPRVVIGAPSLAEHARAEVLEDGVAELAVPGPCAPFWCGQDRLEPILRAGAEQADADVRFGHEMVRLDVRADGARALVRGPRDGTVLDVESRYVVGADGVRGVVGSIAGIPFHGLGSIGYRVTIIFRADLERVLRGRRFFMSIIGNDEFTGAVMPLNEHGRWAAAVELDAAAGESHADFTEERCLALVRGAIGDRSVDVAVERTFAWHAQHRMATSYRRGPVFLAGDAAHLHPPSGGYGSNVGFQDVHNLAWKMAGVLRGWAPDTLLDTYDAERRPVAEATAEQALLLDGVSPDRLGGAAMCDPRTLVMGYRYAAGVVLDPVPGPPFPDPFALTGEPGTRVPDVPLDPGPDGARSSLDTGGQAFVVLARDERWLAAARQVGARTDVPVVARRAAADRPGFADACGAGEHGALLVRPDGFVAWRHAAADPPDPAHGDPAGLLSSALARLVPGSVPARPSGAGI